MTDKKQITGAQAARAIHHDTQALREETRIIKSDLTELMSLLDPQEARDEPDPIDQMLELMAETRNDVQMIKEHLGLQNEKHGID